MAQARDVMQEQQIKPEVVDDLADDLDEQVALGSTLTMA